MTSTVTTESRQTTPGLSDPSTWLDSHGDVLYRCALLRLSDLTVAEDVVQETFLAAIQARANYTGKASESTWLVGILKHKIIDHLRKSQREKPVDPDISAAAEAVEIFDAHGQWKTNISRWSDPVKSLQ